MNTPYLLTENPELTAWHSKQATLLYHFASLDHLKVLHRMVSNLIDGIADPLLHLAKAQNRDSVLTDSRWGTRNTSDNWANNAWPFLKDFQSSLTKDIAARAFERYRITGVNEYFRGMSEYSMQWTTPEEEQRFNNAVKFISTYANRIDETLDDYHDSRWDDSGFAHSFKEFVSTHSQIPRFRIRTDVTGESGKTPVRTGVYVSQDDPYAALQFAWTGNGGGKLRPSKTFNEIGLAALEKVGRNDLWLNDEKMFEFAMQRQYEARFRPTIYMAGEEHRDFAYIAVSEAAFVDRPCEWYFVEIVNGEFENLENDPIKQEQPEHLAKVIGGVACQKAGYYFTPAHPGSRRHFIQGEIVPEFESQYGKTIWQWDTQQE